jgi:murein DD-endopeptidase MepM/ murein hydrolase activator NlpD
MVTAVCAHSPEVSVSQHRAPKRRADKHRPGGKGIFSRSTPSRTPASSTAPTPPSTPSPGPGTTGGAEAPTPGTSAGRHRAGGSGRGRAAAPRTRVVSARAAASRPPSVPKERRGFTRPSGFLVAGTSAIVVAAAGAMSVGSAQAVDSTPASVQAVDAPVGAARATAAHRSQDALGSHLDRNGRPATISRNAGRVRLDRAQQRRLERAAEQQAAARNEALSALASRAEDRAEQIEANLWVLPVSGYDITATFGAGGGLWSSDHTGLDFAAAYGSPVMSVASGVVTEAAYAGAYGNRVIVTHPDGTETWYCHMDSFAVGEGQEVAPGTQVGAIGMTGNTTGPHLHFEVRPSPDVPVDPYTALSAHGVTP